MYLSRTFWKRKISLISGHILIDITYNKCYRNPGGSMRAKLTARFEIPFTNLQHFITRMEGMGIHSFQIKKSSEKRTANKRRRITYTITCPVTKKLAENSDFKQSMWYFGGSVM